MDIYVGNFPFETTVDELRVEFEAFGEVTKVKVITNRVTGRSRGFGFIVMPSEEEAHAAIDGLNGKEIGKRALKVNKAKPRNERRGKRGSRRRNFRENYRKSRARNRKQHNGDL